MRKKISPELRERALRLVQEHQADYPSITAVSIAVARQLGLGRETVRRWVVQAGIDAGERPGVTNEEQAEIRRLKAENRRLREDVEVLRAATGELLRELVLDPTRDYQPRGLPPGPKRTRSEL